VGSAGAAVEGGTVGVAATPAAAGPESGFLAVVGVQAMAAADAQAEDVPAEAGVESPGAAEDTTPVAAEVIPAEVIQVVAAAANGDRARCQRAARRECRLEPPPGLTWDGGKPTAQVAANLSWPAALASGREWRPPGAYKPPRERGDLAHCNLYCKPIEPGDSFSTANRDGCSTSQMPEGGEGFFDRYSR
jgi:hypothetical protein